MQSLEIFGAIIGLIYLYLEYKANKWLWLFGVIMPVVYIFIFYQSKFYADMGINIYYFFASIYGWIVWTKGKNLEHEVRISHTPTRFVLPLTTIVVIIFALIAFILVRFTDSTVPYGDSFTTTLSIVGMWMLAHKYIEQWVIWFVVNIVSCGLYFWKDLYYTGALFAIYAVISIFGYFKWKRMMEEEARGSVA
ncbi:MAG: nicotinamide riboside transporter PnuC [Bacteroidia bacterium]|nr:nicotinamide riboside transporter PnuC [Bacteroidia bacterium]